MSKELENLGFSLSIKCGKSINYVNYQAECLLKEATGNKSNNFSFLREISIKNDSDDDLRDVRVSFRILPDFFEIQPIRITCLEKSKETILDSFRIVLDVNKLYAINESIPGSIAVELTSEDGKLLATNSVNIRFLPIEESASEQWIDEILASFVTPNDPLVKDFLNKARDIRRNKYGTSSFDEYQSHDPNGILEDLDSLYLACQKSNIRYSTTPASFEKVFQRVRLPHEVLEKRCGNCLDVSLLFCSLMEAVGLRPILILTQGHALAGCWLEELAFPNSREDNVQTLLNNASEGFNNIALINAVGFCEDASMNFAEAMDSAKEHLEKTRFDYALDIKLCRREWILPVPTGKRLIDGSVVFDFPTISTSEYRLPNINVKDRRFLPNERKGERNRYDYWEDKLLDLNLRNRLVNYKGGQAGIEIMTTDPLEFLEFLDDHEKINLIPSFLKLGDKEKKEQLRFDEKIHRPLITEQYGKGNLLAVNKNDTAEDALKNLARKSNTSIEESGCNPLFLTLGEIRWYDNDKAAERGTGAMYAPIFLLEAKMPRRKSGQLYTLDYDFADIGLNSTFFQYLKQNHGLDFSRLYPLPRTQSGLIDIRLVYNEIRSIIAPMKNWVLFENRSALSLFNFSHFVMWSDLKNHRSQIMNNKLVASFVYGEKKWNDRTNIIPADEMDERIKPIDVAVSLPADSSQLKAIVDAEKGDSFILDGPPGTGKSQTIANMITNFLYHGKKVLFVAEKEVALDVVKKRLDELHLGQFTLEIGSLNKPKSEILGIYSELLKMGPLESGEGYEQLGDSVMAKRAKLNGIMKALHERGTYFVSPYDAIVGYLENADYRTKSKTADYYIRSLTPNKFSEICNAITSYINYAKGFGVYARSPFVAFQKKDYSIVYREKVFEEVERLIDIAKDCELATYNAFFKEGSLEETYNNAKRYLAIMADLQNGSATWFEHYLDREFVGHGEGLLELANLKAKLAGERDAVLVSFKPEVFTAFDPDALYKEYEDSEKLGLFKKLFAQKDMRKKLKPFLNDKNALKKDGLRRSLEMLKQAHFDEENVKNADPYCRFVLNEYDFSNALESGIRVHELETTLDLAENLQAMDFKNDRESDFANYLHGAGRGAIFSKANTQLKSVFETFSRKKEELLYRYELNLSLYGDTNDYFKYLGGKLTDALASSGRLSEWCNLLSLLQTMKNLLDKDFFDRYAKGEIKEENLLQAFKADVYFAILGRVLPERGLSSLSAASQEELFNAYRTQMDELQHLAVNVVAAKITEKYPKNAESFASSTDAYKLTKLAKNGGRGASIRYIFEEFKELIETLTPCFLMSPVAVAQYLNVETYHFDVVIFDEASQIPTSEAVGAMARADAVIIAGDEQQMPPSNFFVSNMGIGDDDSASLCSVDEDLESLLDDAISLNFPRERLNWHYRSRHESLIAFSNNRFYENSLLTFPSPSDEKDSVSYRYVKGDYQRGKGVNKPEAKEVVNEIIKRLKDDKLRRHSIGVVTFNEAQQNLIDDMLEKELAKHDFDPMPGGEKIFIKNLENVQGDERDVILFSTTYGPDKRFGLSLNFGPLSQKKGERRLNVAVSRAREEMIVISSMRPQDIPAERARNMGASYLRDFLVFAQKGTSSLANRNQNSMGDEQISVASFLKHDLEKLGYSVTENLGSSTFKIDLAMSSKESPNDYVLGIILDNNKNASLTCRDRHINEPKVLNRLNWNIHYLYSVEYLDHKEEVIKSVVNSYNRSLAGEKFIKEEIKKKDPLFVRKVINANPNKRPYTLTQFKPKFDPSLLNESDMLGFFIEVIGTEYPLSQEVLEERFRKTFGLGRIGSITRNKFNLALQKLSFTQESCGGKNFYYPRHMSPNSNLYWRETIKDDFRRLIDISYIEIGNCAADLLATQGKMSVEDLCHQVNTAFGYSILKKTGFEYVRAAIKWNCSRRNGLYLAPDGMIGIR